MASILEIKRLMGGRTAGYKKVREILASAPWEIVGFTASTFIIRQGDTNTEYSRSTGKVISKHTFTSRARGPR